MPFSYCVAIGHRAGFDLTDETGFVIIGDDVSAKLPPEQQPDVLYIGASLRIGRTVLGQPCNLQDIVRGFAGSVYGIPD